jgi:hypothetical protein
VGGCLYIHYAFYDLVAEIDPKIKYCSRLCVVERCLWTSAWFPVSIITWFQFDGLVTMF